MLDMCSYVKFNTKYTLFKDFNMVESDKSKETQTRISDKVLFVRNLPYRLSDEEFEKTFSEIGPLKRAFVAREKGVKDKCRGFGYVTFALAEDAKKAKDCSVAVSGRRLKIDFANKRPRQKQRKRKEEQELDLEEDLEDRNQTQTKGYSEDKAEHDKTEHKNKPNLQQSISAKRTHNESETSEDESFCPRSPVKMSQTYVETAKKVDQSEEKKRKPKSQRKPAETDAGRTVVVSGFPEDITSKQVHKKCSKISDNIEKITFPVVGREKPTAYLLFKTHKEARQALPQLDQKVIKGNVMRAVLLSKEGKSPSRQALQKSKLIVRNLAFKCTESILKETFSVFGKVMEASVPTRMEGKRTRKRGFGFVQFTNVFDAAKAVEKMNMKEILGRPVAVDFAVPRDQYQTLKEKHEDDKGANTSKDKGGEASDEDKAESVGTDEVELSDIEPDDKIRSGSIPDDDNKDDDDDDDDDDDGDGDDDGDDGDDYSDDNHEKDDTKKTKRESDVKQGLTIFIRNLSFNSTEESVMNVFKQFGKMFYCKLVIDPFTEQNRGAAFIKFRNKESVDSCLAKGEEEGDSEGIHLDGRKLQVSMAVSRGKANQMIQEKKAVKKEPRDKRNLYLAREGVILPGSTAAEGLSKADLLKREKAEVEKKAKLKNPNYFVSTTRLCFRNLPLKVDEKALRAALIKSTAAERTVKVKNVLIMRNKERIDSSGKGRSLGFGFVELANHKEALSVLRATNNNPDVFGAERRLIVEFAIENSLALKAKEQRVAKQKRRELALKGNRERKDEGERQSKTNKEKRLEKAAARREVRKRKREAKKKRKTETTVANNENVRIRKENYAKGKRKNEINPIIKREDKRKKQKFTSPSPSSKIGEANKFTEQKQFREKETDKKHLEIAEQQKDKSSESVKRKKAKRKAKEMKDESNFNEMVHKYKTKLFGKNVGTLSAKRARWFE